MNPVEESPFGIRIHNVDSALRFAYSLVKDAHEAERLLSSRNPRTREQGREHAVHVLRQIRDHILQYTTLRGSFDSRKKEEELLDELQLLQRQSTISLARYGKDHNVNHLRQSLQAIAKLSDRVEHTLKLLEKQTSDSSEVYYAGVDGGSTKTSIWVANASGKVFAKARTGPIPPTIVGFYKTAEQILLGIKMAVEKKGKNFNTMHFKHICVGMGGLYGTLIEHKRLQDIFNNYNHRFHNNIEQVTIVSDAILAWYSAFEGKPGILVLSGTGHVVYGRKGTREMISGDSSINKDWRNVVHLEGRNIGYHAALTIDKRLARKSETRLVKRFRQAYNEGRFLSKHHNAGASFTEAIRLVEKSILTRGNHLGDSEVASMAKDVFELARMGDADAVSIIHEATDTAAEYIMAVAEHIGYDLKGEIPVRYVGSVITHPMALNKLRENLPNNVDLKRAHLSPERAALRIAMQNVHFY